mgnify:FL=1
MTTPQERASEAKRILESDVFKRALDELEMRYLDEWRSTFPEDTDARERLFVAVNVLDEVQRHLRIIIEDGTLTHDRLVRVNAWRSTKHDDKL